MTLLFRAKAQERQVMATGSVDHYRQIFELTRMHEAIGIYGSEAEAVAAVGDR